MSAGSTGALASKLSPSSRDATEIPVTELHLVTGIDGEVIALSFLFWLAPQQRLPKMLWKVLDCVDTGDPDICNQVAPVAL